MDDPVAYSDIIQKKKQLQANARAMFEKGDYDNVVNASQYLQFVITDADDEAMEQFGYRVDAVNRSQRRYDSIFLLAYILGSGLLAFEYVRQKLRHDQSQEANQA